MANRVYLEGNITRDPLPVETQSGTSMAFLHVAADRQWRGADGNPKQDTVFTSVVCFGAVADYVTRTGANGRPVIVEGSLRSRTVERADGLPVRELEVVADTVKVFQSRVPAVAAADGEARAEVNAPAL